MGSVAQTSHARVRSCSNFRSGLLAGLIALTAGSACVSDQDFLIVENAVWFGSRDDCTLEASGQAPLAMTADVSFDSRIALGFVVTNNQSPNPGSNTGINDSEVAITSAEVRLSFSGGAIAGSEFEVTVPSDSISGGNSRTFLIQIPTAVTLSIRESMTAGEYETLEMEVTFKGRKYGQAGNSSLGEVATRPYTFPLEICMGCLTYCDDECQCPTPTEWVGTCGFAQELPVYHPACTEP